MDTPICDFVRQYAESNTLRLHMPGHKGTAFLGMESLDITEIDGADSLYEASGIILQSEANASRLFGCETFYSTEGSSQCIRAMLHMAMLYAKHSGRKPLIAAARNVHKSFLTAAALLDTDIVWLYPEHSASYLSCILDAQKLDALLQNTPQKPTAIYLTSPDYLGQQQNIQDISQVCHKHGALLLVDNAHGAYLKFLPQSQHPIDLGADICCDSAHKTLPVLTGGAYLHISPSAPPLFSRIARNALALFGSTSPSYLILQSLDAANSYLAQYRPILKNFSEEVEALKMHLQACGYCLYGQEPLKITIVTKPYGYTGDALAGILLKEGIVCEFSDSDFLVLMLTPEIGDDGLQRLTEILLGIPKAKPIDKYPPQFRKRERCLSIRDALLSVPEVIPVTESCGRILASACVGCPPAVPILSCGERIDSNAIACFQYYGIDSCEVVLESEEL